VLLNGALQATAGGYLQTSVIAVASLFGPLPVQAMMSGQAAVAVVVSGVQVLSAAAFLWKQSGESVASFDIALTSAEERSASTFFAFSTLFLILCTAAHAWLVRLPIYKRVAAPLEQYKSIRDSTSAGRNDSSDESASILRLAKANVTYEVAVAYVFVVTIVSDISSTCGLTTNSLCIL
jgi:equilibrative nucleoside transporter 1/2/3